MTLQVETYEENLNPLDNIEELLNDHNWVYSRMNDAELLVEVAGRHCNYRILFIWQEAMNALQFNCQYDLKINKDNLFLAGASLLDINESLWMGHFEVNRESMTPAFRHTCLLRAADSRTIYEVMEDLVDVSLAQCERNYPAFKILSMNQTTDAQTMSLAVMETIGES